jgi:catechol 2,3-dioxygenase-like lactoylglutathione lyase family enzyme
MPKIPTKRLLQPQSVFKATAVNHISYGVSDYARTRDWFMDLFGMTCEFDDGQRCSVAFGDPPRALYIGKSKLPDGKANVDHLAYSIADFDLKASEAELKRLGLDPEYDGEFAWTVLDPDGYRVQICAEHGVFPGAALPGASSEGKIPSGTKANRPGVFKATAVNHIAFGASDYARTRDYYVDLLGMKVVFEDGLKCSVAWGSPEDAIYITPSKLPGGKANTDHLAISVADFDLEKSEAALKSFGLHPEADGAYAWTVLDPDGYRIQVCAEYGVYPGAAQDYFHVPKKS